MDRTILAIESSCDETSASIIKNGIILSNIISSQSIHTKFGGVVPELASREHIKKITIVAKEAIRKADILLNSLNAIAFTQGPGLLGPLLVGTSFSKALSYSLDIPIIAINHLKAHIFANFIDDPKPQFPFLSLLISGGHTQLSIVHDYFKIENIGQTQDDALGEAFDKIAKYIGIPYPGGPLIDKYSKNGNPDAFQFPDTKMPNLDFSFSGIKTGFMNFIKKESKNSSTFVEDNLYNICASIQKKLISMVLGKLQKAIKQTKITSIAISGGVAANSYLRKVLEYETEKNQWKLFIPKIEYCTDNAAMIAKYADFHYINNKLSNLEVVPKPRF